MTLIQALILAFVEGITEFLPVSSTAHLIITSTILGLPQNEYVSFFEVFIQGSAILAVVVIYFEYILKHMKYVSFILASFIPTAIIGLLMHDTIKNVFFQSNELIAYALIGVGVLFVVVEWMIKTKRLKVDQDISDMTYKHAIIIGIIQATAIVPGVSRAGAVIIGMMGLGYKRTESALYSFLLAVPTIVGASVFDLIKTDLSVVQGQWGQVAIACVVSFLSAYVFVKWFIGYLQKHTLQIFAAYRILLGYGILLWL